MNGLIVDLFAGGGGASAGIEAALGRPVDIAINHDPIALAVHKANHPRTHHVEEDIWRAQPAELVAGRRVAILWASPDCTHFSIAKGGKPRQKKIRSLAWAVTRWAKAVRPAVIFLENVREFQGWGPLTKDGRPDKRFMGRTFRAWKRRLERLGYVVDYRILDASLYGAPTKRRRLFLIARCDGQAIVWPEVTHGKGKLPLHTAAECIDWSLLCPSIFERKKPLAEKTLWRIAQGIKRFVLETAEPFIVPMNANNPPMSFERPLGTVTSQQNRFNLVAPTLIQRSWGEDMKRNGGQGQRARYLDLHKPLGTVVGGGIKHALVAAFLEKGFSERPDRWKGAGSQHLKGPAPTVTTRDHTNLAAATLVKLRGECHGAQLGLPLPTLTAGGLHVAEVRAFLTAYYSTDGTLGKGQDLRAPMRAVTARQRLGLVTVHGVDYQIADIGMRMLKPHELLRAQFRRFASDYDLSAARTQEHKVRLIGNSVCPEVAEAIVAANVTDRSARRAA